MSIKDGPFKSAVEANTDKVIKQELVTYSVDDNNNVVRKITTRTFFEDDYIDSTAQDLLTLKY